MEFEIPHETMSAMALLVGMFIAGFVVDDFNFAARPEYEREPGFDFRQRAVVSMAFAGVFGLYLLAPGIRAEDQSGASAWLFLAVVALSVGAALLGAVAYAQRIRMYSVPKLH